MFRKLKRLFYGIDDEDPWQRPAPPKGDPMAILNLKVGQKVRIDGGDLHFVAGRVDYQRGGDLWHNYRLIDPRQQERWLSVEFWDEGMQVFLFQAITLFELPTAPLASQYFATSPDRKILYHLVEAAEAEIAHVENDRRYLDRYGLEPIAGYVGDKFTYWQYRRADYDREYLSIEIWGDEKFPNKGLHLDPTVIEVLY